MTDIEVGRTDTAKPLLACAQAEIDILEIAALIGLGEMSDGREAGVGDIEAEAGAVRKIDHEAVDDRQPATDRAAGEPQSRRELLKRGLVSGANDDARSSGEQRGPRLEQRIELRQPWRRPELR